MPEARKRSIATTQRAQSVLRRAGFPIAHLSKDHTCYTQGVLVWQSQRFVEGEPVSFLALRYFCTALPAECPFDDADDCDQHVQAVEQDCIKLLADHGISAEPLSGVRINHMRYPLSFLPQLSPDDIQQVINTKMRGADDKPLPEGFIVPQRGYGYASLTGGIDNEMLHAAEDDILAAALYAIAGGRCTDPMRLAHAALDAWSLNYTRWFS